MRLKFVATAIVAAAAFSLLAAPVDAAAKKKQRMIASNGHTVFVSRDEDGRTRTRIIIQKRSYLDPGTETFPARPPFITTRGRPTIAPTACSTTRRSAATRPPLPGPFTLPGKNNPWIQY